MIDNPLPDYWKDLQKGVCQIFSDMRLQAEEAKVMMTPRGKVELDVYAIDTDSVDKVSYVVECKNWATTISQSVVHSFTTVMHEVGANIGYIVSKMGLQPGAQEYAQNTNITGLTYLEFQEHYFESWFNRYYCEKVTVSNDSLHQYTEPINSRREMEVAKLSAAKKERFFKLKEEYRNFAMLLTCYHLRNGFMRLNIPVANDISKLKKAYEKSLNNTVQLQSVYYRQLLYEILGIIEHGTNLFNDIFNRNIFV